MKNLAIELGHVTITTHDGATLIDDVSLSLPHGSRTALIGRSGSGKSLIAATLTGRLPSTLRATGDISTPARTALIHQDSADAFNPIVRIGTQLAIAEPDEQTVIAQLTELGFENPAAVLQRFPAELSGGQRQRLAIAMGLLAGADLVVADESTTALDPINQQSVIRALATITDASVLFITHDIALAKACCDTIYVVEAGKIVESGDLVAVVDHPQHAATQALIHQARSRQQVSS